MKNCFGNFKTVWNFLLTCLGLIESNLIPLVLLLLLDLELLKMNLLDLLEIIIAAKHHFFASET